MITSGKIRFVLGISVFYFLLPDVSCSWNLTSLNIWDDVLIWRFAVWKNRAFLAIPRSTDEEKKAYRPTLVEVPWPELNSNLPISVANAAIVPFSKSGPSKRNYEALVSVTGLDTDARGRLWVLDAPEEYNRWPRIVIYDLKRNDRLVSSTELINVSAKRLKSLVIDPFEDQWGFRAYIADAGDETIIIYSLGQDKWWKLRMLHGPEIPRVQATDLAISRKNSILYMTGQNTHNLFSINLEKVRTDEIPWKESSNITVTWLGKKLGLSTGLFCDLKDGLHYFMTSEKASVRWDTKFPLDAESHSVLMQNDNVPCITDYKMDARRNVWGLVNSECSDIMKKNIANKSILKFRTVNIVKYSFI
ncbi:uncharacterized protein [Linepithema humile]|uniref:uncharacterized protein isoform X2 n=1 Tax=Linepithema humile TaxID=83485 RepID=UPI00351F54C1